MGFIASVVGAAAMYAVVNNRRQESEMYQQVAEVPNYQSNL